MAIYGGVAPNGDTVGPTDQRSKIGPLTSRHRGRVWSATILCLLWRFCAPRRLQLLPSNDPSRPWPPSLQRQSVGRTERWRTRDSIRHFYVRGSIISRPGHIRADVLNENDGIGLSIRPTMRPASSFPVAVGAAPGLTLPHAEQHGHLPGEPARHRDGSSNAPVLLFTRFSIRFSLPTT